MKLPGLTDHETGALFAALAISLPIALSGLALGYLTKPATAAPQTPGAGLVFLLLTNDASGAQHVRAAVPMAEADCLPLQQAVWSVPFPTVADTADGPLPSVDAACVPAAQWAREVAGGATVEGR